MGRLCTGIVFSSKPEWFSENDILKYPFQGNISIFKKEANRLQFINISQLEHIFREEQNPKKDEIAVAG